MFPEEFEALCLIFFSYAFSTWSWFFSGNLHEEKRAAQTTFEDFLVRRFLTGTWHRSLASEVIIKRRHNIVVLSFLVSMERMLPRQVYFLQGYSETMLSGWLKMPVKIELQSVASQSDMVFKKIWRAKFLWWL